MKNFSNGGYTGIDHLGRVTAPFLPEHKTDRQVGIFYFLWLGQSSSHAYGKAVYDSTEIMKLSGWKDILFHASDERSPAGEPHYWGKPLFGYYNSRDEWVIRKQLEMLCLSGVDFLVFDTTNALTFPEVYPRILSVIEEMRGEGFPAVQVVFYTHHRSMDTVRKLYDELYKPRLYPESWYMADGKPLIIAYTDPEDELKEDENNILPEPLSGEILDFFTFRHPVWPANKGIRADDFSWIEWSYPQPLRGDMMNVSVAAHSDPPFSASYTRGHLNFGRGYNPELRENIAEDCEKGAFFQRQWDNALQADPNIIFVTGWNEWIAGKLPWNGEYMLCDQASFEYSRDCEPMDGGYRDAFYLQIVRNVSRYKKLNIENAARKPLIYEKPGRDTQRDAQGGADGVHYFTPAPRNSISKIKADDDGESFLIEIECREEVKTHIANKGWMNIFFGKNEPSLHGWHGYTGRIIASESGELTVLHTDDGIVWQKTGSGTYRTEKTKVSMEIPFGSLGLAPDDQSIYFKVWDFDETESGLPDIDKSYLEGSALPMGRLSCYYPV